MKHQLKRGYQRLNAVISVSVDILGIVPTDHNLRDNDSSGFPQPFLLVGTAAIVTLINSMLGRTCDGV